MTYSLKSQQPCMSKESKLANQSLLSCSYISSTQVYRYFYCRYCSLKLIIICDLQFNHIFNLRSGCKFNIYLAPSCMKYCLQCQEKFYDHSAFSKINKVSPLLGCFVVINPGPASEAFILFGSTTLIYIQQYRSWAKGSQPFYHHHLIGQITITKI